MCITSSLSLVVWDKEGYLLTQWTEKKKEQLESFYKKHGLPENCILFFVEFGLPVFCYVNILHF